MIEPLVLPFPPSGNTYYRSIRMGQSCRVLISKKGREYREQVIQLVDELRIADPNFAALIPFDKRLSVSVLLNAPTRRKYDIDNRSKALLDALQHAGIYLDDEQIDVLILRRGEVCKGGRVTVSISCHLKDGVFDKH